MDITKLKGQVPDSIYDQLPMVIDKFQINTPNRLSHFLGQCCLESGGFKIFMENLNYSSEGLMKVFPKYFPDETIADQYNRNPEKIASRVYADRMGNGPESTLEGFKFRGRGAIQLTGKSNYDLFSKSIGEDLVSNPDLLSTKYSLVSAAWFFEQRKINVVSDKGINDTVITEVTHLVNGGINGLAERITYTNKFASLLA